MTVLEGCHLYLRIGGPSGVIDVKSSSSLKVKSDNGFVVSKVMHQRNIVSDSNNDSDNDSNDKDDLDSIASI